MQREIKFRGKRTYNQEWIYGDLMQIGGMHILDYSDPDEVDYVSVLPETVGQFTGLKDKNGKEIYEGDIIKSNNSEGKDLLSIIVWDDDLAKLVGSPEYNGDPYLKGFTTRPASLFTVFEIIGNIHDNPELVNRPNGGL